MNKEIIESALLSALSLLISEAESVVSSELSDEYTVVIDNIENAIKELESYG